MHQTVNHHNHGAARWPGVRLLAACALVLLMVNAPGTRAEPVWSDVERIVAIGDIHGDYDQYIEALARNELIDDRLRWRGGETHLVQLGDVPDRGPDTKKIIEHLQKLKRQAKRAGGRVHTLIGNHEAMNVYGDLRYVHPGEYEAMATRRSDRVQRDYIERVQAWMADNQPNTDRSFETLAEKYPEGYVEHRMAWAPDGDMGRWVMDNPTVIMINDIIFVHAGLSPHEPPVPLEAINEAVHDILAQGEQVSGENITNTPTGPLWYRGLATAPAEEERAALEAMLDHYGANHIVVAHTPTGGEVRARFDGQVILADVGMAAHYGGHDANLVIEGDAFFEVNSTGKRELGVD